MQSYTLYLNLQNFYKKNCVIKPNMTDRANIEDKGRVYNNERLCRVAQPLIIIYVMWIMLFERFCCRRFP